MKISTPKRKYECDCILDPFSYLDFNSSDPDVHAEITTGKSSGKENMNEPPSLNFNFENLIAIVDGMKQNDQKKMYESTVKVCKETLNYTWETKPRTPIQHSEAQMEHCIENCVDLDNYGRSVEFINPSRGTVYRITRHYPNSITRFTTDADETYKADICEMLRQMKLNYSLERWTVDPNVLYYVSFNGTLAERMGMKHYIGYEVNPSSLTNSGYCASQSISSTSISIEYYRGGQLKSFDYLNRSKNIIPVDVVHKFFSQNNGKYVVRMGLMHDIYTTLQIIPPSRLITKKVQLTYDSLFLIGDYTDDGHRIFDKDGKVVYTASQYAHSCRTDLDGWRYPDVDGKIMAAASYMITKYTATVTRLGKRYLARPIREGIPFDFRYRGVPYRYRTRYHRDCIAFNSDFKPVPRMLMPFRLSQGVGHIYCTSSYENVVSVSVKYVNDLENLG